MNTIVARYRFHPVAVTALAAVVFAGFAKTYYFRIFSGSPPLAQAAHIHGMIATVWIALHYTQARLVAAHRVDLHRRLGIFAAFVAALLAVQAISMAVSSAAAGHAPPGRNPLQFLSVAIGTTTVFAVFVGSALALRRQREWHKRLMLLATMTLLVPAMGRLDAQIMQPLGLPRLLLAPGVTVAFVAWAWVHDWRRLGRVHPAYIVGGIALIVSIPLRRWIGFTDAWLPIARWLVGQVNLL
jgi:ABC-type multidrug transport system permease subunit